MARLGLEQDRWLAELQAEWATVAGAGVASHSRPGRLERGNLTVFVDSSVWLSELSRYGQKQMLANIRRRFGESRVSTLSFRLDPDAGRR
jgi:predicted nucleic acid-binding Zn ribbon protein